MTAHDLYEFLNVYKLITTMDPRVDRAISKASVEQLLSGELLSYSNDEMNELVADKVIKEPVTDYTVFDVYDHIESWRTRMRPTMITIEDIARESKNVMRASNAAADDASRTKRPTSSGSLEQTMRDKNVVVANSSRYLSNIDKYINSGERHARLSKIFQQVLPARDDDVIDPSDAAAHLHSDERNDGKIPDEHKRVTTIITELSATSQQNRRTLLTPSSAYLELRPKSVVDDDKEVRTYCIN